MDHLYKHVSSATGESMETVRAMGFQPVFDEPFIPLPGEMQERRVFSDNVTCLDVNEAA